MRASNRSLRPVLGLSLTVLAGCNTTGFDLDFRNPGGPGTSEAVRTQTAPRPRADDRGIISYPNYQVVVARGGDTVSAISRRLGLNAETLARHNGISPDVPLRAGEILVLPRRVAEPSPATGAPSTGPLRPNEEVDITTLAGEAIQRAESTSPKPSPTPRAPARAEPVRHKVERGETAYSIARLYNVTVRSLGEWNGLGPDMALREGQYLIIPVASEAPPPRTANTSRPGAGSATPTPPSATAPLPRDEAKTAEKPAAPVASPGLSSEKTTSTRMGFPVKGKIIRAYQKGKNEGIDIAASAGGPVVAAADGAVVAITRNTDQVPILVVRHPDNLLSVYANIQDIAVQKGDSVKRGQTIAKVRATDPAFVHFELRKGIDSVDPMPYLQ